jgi:histidinol-phosphate aminotransferase
MPALTRRKLLGGSVATAVSLGFLPLTAQELQFNPQPGIVRLSSNENPYGPSPRALLAADTAAQHGAYYPGRLQNDLQAMIAERHQLDIDRVVLSSGSNEALCAAMAAYGREGSILAPELTYGPHLRYAEQIGVNVVRVPLAADMSIDLDAMATRAARGDISLVYICNPNNPTGMLIEPQRLANFCRATGKDAVILVDEAYNELTDKPEANSMMDLVRADENVIVMRTFSKIYALAGLRIGYTMAPAVLAARVGDHVMAWPNVVGLAAAIASYDDEAFVRFSRERIVQGREMVCEVFASHGLPYLPSQTNFVYANIGRDATEFAKQMLARNVRIRGAYPPYDTYSRVSMGKLEDLRTFARVFDETYSS